MKLFLVIFMLSVLVISCLDPAEQPIVIGNLSGTVLDAVSFLPIPGVTISTEPSTSTVTSGSDGKFAMNDLAEGDYVLTASRTGYNDASSEVSVIAERSVNADLQMVPLASILVINTNELNFGTATSNQNIQIQNGGYGTLSWSISKNQPWLTVTPSSGTTEAETDVINVAVDRTGYNPGNYSDIISIITNTNAASVSTLMVVLNTEGPQLTIAPDSYDYGTAESSHQFEISNSGIDSLDWSASTNTSWLSMDVTSGSIDSGTNILTVTIDRFELQEGQYSGGISISSNGGNQLITVSATVSTTSELILSVSELDFANTYGELQVVLSNSTEIPISWQAVPGQTWISIDPSQGIIETTPLVATVTVNREALAIGAHSGSVDFVYPGGTATLTVQVNVTSVPLENPVLQISSQTGNSVTLGWTRPSNSTSFLRYDIRRSISPDITEEVPVLTSIPTYSENSYLDENLTLSQTYYYRIYAVNTDGYGTPSNEISYTTDFTAPGTWVLQATIGVAQSYHDIFMVNNSLGYVSMGKKIYEYLGSSWNEVQSFPNYVSAIDGTGQNDIWTAGYYYDIWHYDGITWSQKPDISSYNINDIQTIGTNDVWFGGGDTNPFVSHFDGSSYTDYELNSDANDIVDIEFTSSNDGYALTNDGWIFHWNGVGWSVHTTDEQMPGSGYSYSGISVLASGEIWICIEYGWVDEVAGGYYSHIIYYNGSTWNSTYPQTSGSTSSGGYIDIKMISSTQGWAVGNDGNILFSGNGISWSLVNSPTTRDIYSIQMLDANNGWAIGYDGTILKYTGN